MLLSDIITSGRTTAQTVTDIDGLLKWALHNLFINSATGATQGVTVVSGADYTVAFKGTGSITYSGAASGTLNGTGASDLVSVEVTASTTTLTCTVSGSITDVRVYRSDLGGMQLNSDGTDYVATGGSAVYFPGVAYDANGVCLGIQSFESRTNVLIQSNDVSNAAWPKTSCATLAKDVTGVDGNTSGVTIQDDNAGGTGNVTIRQGIIVSTSTEYTFWRWLKADQLDWAFLRVAGGIGASGDGGVWFDLTNGTVGTENTGYTGNITSYANGYYRCEITFTTGASDTTGNFWVYVCDSDGSVTVDLDGTSSIIDGGGQLEVGNRASPNIPTFASSVTRGGDDMSKAASEFSYNQSAGTVVIEYHVIETASAATRCAFSLNDGTTSERLEQLHTAADLAKMYIADGGVEQANIGSNAASLTSVSKLAFAWAVNDFAVSLNGQAVDTDAAGTIPTITDLQLGNGSGGLLNGYITSIEVYPDRVSNAKLVEASTL